MSRRGGKRRTVVQLDSTSSKLYRYGYSKGLHSGDTIGKGTSLNMLGAYSGSDSESEKDDPEEKQTEEMTPADRLGEVEYAENSSTKTDLGASVLQDTSQKDIDDELKNFLSEIEAIPMPVDSSLHQGDIPAVNTEHEPVNNGYAAPKSIAIDSGENKAASTGGKVQYSMFVKGESEFVNSQTETEGKDRGKAEEKKDQDEIDIPEEPVTPWQVVQDETTQYYYYWNTLTNEVTWEIPADYTQYLLLHKEYTDCISKFSAEQIQAHRERKDKKISQSAAHEEHGDITPVTVETVPDGKSRRQSPNVSPRPDSDFESSQRRHRSDRKKRTHKSKKHKRKRGDDDDLQDGTGNVGKSSPKMPDIDPSQIVEREALDAVGPKSLSIVPYLSDPEDDNNDDSNDMPELGPAVQTAASEISQDPVIPSDSDKGPEPNMDMPQLGPEVAVDDEMSVEEKESAGAEASNPTALVLPPPPPPPEEEKDEKAVKQEVAESYDPERKYDLKEEGLKDQGMEDGTFAQCEVRESLKEAKRGDEEMEYLDIKSESTEHLISSRPSDNPSVVEEKGGDKNEPHIVTAAVEKESMVPVKEGRKQKRDMLDMFSEDFFISVGPENGKEGLQGEGKVSDEVPIVKEESDAKFLEEGEIPDGPQSDIGRTKDGKEVTGVKPSEGKQELNAGIEAKIGSSKHQSSQGVISDKSDITAVYATSNANDIKNVPSKVMNIVGYGSDEEEEGEVKDKDDEPSKIATEKLEKKERSKKLKDSGSSSKRDSKFFSHKANEKKSAPKSLKSSDSGKQKRHGSSEEHRHPDLIRKDNVLASKESVPQSVDKIKEQSCTEQDMDVDFEDLDDLDRALEMALVKKLEKKKEELQQVSSSLTVQTDDSVDSLPRGQKDSGDHREEPVKTDIPEDKDNGAEAEKLKSEVKDIAELALSKLEFLDISTDNLSRLQVLYVELQTRLTDWNAGGLSTQYFCQQLAVAEGLLEQYEKSAVPEGWACQWDSKFMQSKEQCSVIVDAWDWLGTTRADTVYLRGFSLEEGLIIRAGEEDILFQIKLGENGLLDIFKSNNRYYYRNKLTNHIQWGYPDGDQGESADPPVKQEGERQKEKRGESEERRRSRHRKKDEKERSKYDKRSSSHRHRKKRRRRRDPSSSSSSSIESEHHRSSHHRSKRKKRHRAERSPSVQIVDKQDSDEVIFVPEAASQTPVVADDPKNSPISQKPASSPESAAKESNGTVTASATPSVPTPPPDAPSTESNEMPSDAGGEEKIHDRTQEEKEESENTAVISKPPQIIVPPQLAAALPVDSYALSAAPTGYTMAAPTISTTVTPPQPDQGTSQTQALGPETDKVVKKKKKDKKLASGSSSMLKKKGMSSMVQKWQKVMKEVEKEDQAKELKQAAIRQKIKDLK